MKIRLLLSLITILILIAGFSYSYVNNEIVNASQDKKNELATEFPAIDFQLTSMEKEKVKLSDFRGKKVILCFWKSQQISCAKQLAELQKVYDQQQDVVVLTVNFDPENDISEYLNEKNINIPVLLDQDGKVEKEYQIHSVPTLFFIDEKGAVKKQSKNYLSSDEMLKIIDEMK